MFFSKNTTRVFTIDINRNEIEIATSYHLAMTDKGGDFLKNPQGLNMVFGIPGTYLSFLFLFWIIAVHFRLKSNTPKHRREQKRR